MSSVKWIKIVTDIFDDEKILLIESLPEADSIIVIWFKLLCLAGKQNNSGIFQMNNRMPYTEEMLAVIFRRKPTIITLALRTFEQFGMIEIINDTITIPNWEKHQNESKLESMREYNRIAKQKERQRKQILLSDNLCQGNVNDSQYTDIDIDREEDIEKDKDIDKKTSEVITSVHESVPYQEIMYHFNQICTSLPKIKGIDGPRKKSVSSRWKTYKDIEIFITLFQKTESSNFLSGRSGKDWRADFDWIMKPQNITKILEGVYDSKSSIGASKQVVSTNGNPFEEYR